MENDSRIVQNELNLNTFEIHMHNINRIMY